jgi:hypothetical protein
LVSVNFLIEGKSYLSFAIPSGVEPSGDFILSRETACRNLPRITRRDTPDNSFPAAAPGRVYIECWPCVIGVQLSRASTSCIIPRSSCAKMWQCTTNFLGKSTNLVRILTVLGRTAVRGRQPKRVPPNIWRLHLQGRLHVGGVEYFHHLEGIHVDMERMRDRRVVLQSPLHYIAQQDALIHPVIAEHFLVDRRCPAGSGKVEDQRLFAIILSDVAEEWRHLGVFPLHFGPLLVVVAAAIDHLDICHDIGIQ